ncbi:MAG: hypothetical protein KC996_08690 [Phycisphaerales bacterium]|nr:hypothetical protein [Phycisphaerales bacterium]
MLEKAWTLSSAYEFDSLTELRLELLIERYLPLERIVELHMLLLDDPEETARAKSTLAEIQQRLDRIEASLQKQLALLEHQSKSTLAQSTDELSDQLAFVRRNLSLTRYYIGWSGYSRAVLDDRPVTRTVFEAFGWLFGAKGQLPTMDDLNHASLEYEHVARAAIGTALCKALDGDVITARSWLKRIESDHAVEAVIQEQAVVRRLQVEAIGEDWSELLDVVSRLHADRDGPLQTPEARFVAIKVLQARDRSRATDPLTDQLVRVVLEDLVKRGEIGHILDLQRRFGSLPLLADRFISQYASAIIALEEAETRSDRYITAASLFANAIKSKDAPEYPSELLDCRLKLAYCEIRSDRSAEALKVIGSVLDQSPEEPILEQARWLRLIAMDLGIQAGSTTLDEDRKQAIIEYILAYPGTKNTAKLMLSHGVVNGVDPLDAVNALLALPDDDPSAAPAHRMLVQLFHRQYLESQRTDLAAAINTIEQAEWVWSHTPDEPADLADATSRLSVIRMTLDVAMDNIEKHKGLITRAIIRGLLLVDRDPKLLVFKDEILLRRIQFLLSTGETERAEDELDQMSDRGGIFAQSATRLLFASALEEWQGASPTPKTARRVVELGTQLLEYMLPRAPEPIDANLSAILSAIAHAARSEASPDREGSGDALAYRLARITLDRGVPDESLLRMTAELAQARGDLTIALDAWLRLLAQYTSNEPQWYEARYESFRLLIEIDPDRARQAINQHRVLYPNPGPEPWGSRIQELISTVPGGDG